MRGDSKKLGAKLRFYREVAKKDVRDVSEAVELDTGTLVNIEAGKTEPDEETLALLMSHFNLLEDQAVELWQIAGYDTLELGSIEMNEDKAGEPSKDETPKELRINLPSDVKVMYTDMAQIMTNKYGIVVQFIQNAPGNNAQIVSRVGMSKEHAKSLVKILQKNLES